MQKFGFYFVRFMGWFILYSFLYFLILDIAGYPPGDKGPQALQNFLYYGLSLISIPIWWFSWKWFEKKFGNRLPAADGDTRLYFLSLRSPALMYYLMILKPFLLVMGANGVITLEFHEGGWRTFYIWNFIILYIYALPFFIIKTLKMKKAYQAKIMLSGSSLSLFLKESPVAQIPFSEIQAVTLDSSGQAALVEGSGQAILVAGKEAKITSFYAEGAEEICSKLKEAAGDKVKTVESLKAEIKARSFKPFP